MGRSESLPRPKGDHVQNVVEDIAVKEVPRVLEGLDGRDHELKLTKTRNSSCLPF
jgi:hypothetical protein